MKTKELFCPKEKAITTHRIWTDEFGINFWECSVCKRIKKVVGDVDNKKI